MKKEFTAVESHWWSPSTMFQTFWPPSSRFVIVMMMTKMMMLRSPSSWLQLSIMIIKITFVYHPLQRSSRYSCTLPQGLDKDNDCDDDDDHLDDHHDSDCSSYICIFVFHVHHQGVIMSICPPWWLPMSIMIIMFTFVHHDQLSWSSPGRDQGRGDFLNSIGWQLCLRLDQGCCRPLNV